jgi:chemotaxis protein methyltransferase CheR
MPVEGVARKLVASPAPNSGDPAYLKIRDLIYKTSGIYHSAGKLYLLVARCTRRMLALGIANPATYMDRLCAVPTGDAELRLLLNEITIGESYMFRHPAQLEALRNVILPQILANKGAAGPKRLRFWSA